MPRDRRGDFGTYIGIHRTHQGKNQPQLAAVCQPIPGQSKISDWETSKELPTQESDVRAIARALSIDEDFLVWIWNGDKADTEKKKGPIINRAYNVTSKGGGTTEDPY